MAVSHFCVERNQMASEAGLSNTAGHSIDSNVRITTHGKMTNWVSFALDFLEVYPLKTSWWLLLISASVLEE